ncbi:MAG: hypothetical protein ACE5K1_10990 [Acidiferrobacterales bacterium]
MGRKRTHALLSGALAILLSLALISCGQDGPVASSLEGTGSIVANPATIEWNVGAGAGCSGTNPPAQFNNHRIQITTFNPDGTPIGEADIEMTLELSDNTTSPIPVMFLYDDLNGNGVLEAAEQVSSIASPNVYRTTTDESTGVKFMWLQVALDAGCSYAANFRIFSGALVPAFVSVDVEAM